MGLGIASVIAMLGLFVVVIVASYELLHEDRANQKPSPQATVQVLGPEETVFSWARDRCEEGDIPDLPARAFRDDAGRVHLVTTHIRGRQFIGSDLDRVTHSCDVIFRSNHNSDPSQYDDAEWLAAPYTLDGRTVYMLVHNEYQGHAHPGQCSSGEYLKCWYNAVTLAVSDNGGSSFRDARPPPQDLVAAPPYRYRSDEGPYGIFSPSNIVRKDDGYYYAIVMAQQYKRQQLGSCLMRTDRLDVPNSWRAWDGSEFRVTMQSPYQPGLGSPADHVCETVSKSEIANMHESLTYNTYLEKYVLVGLAASRIPGKRGLTWGIYYSVSDDLIDWSDRELIRQVELPWTFKCGDPDPILYPSLLDADSPSRNFETTGRRPYLYFTRIHYRDCVQTLNRDLVRARLEFSKERVPP